MNIMRGHASGGARINPRTFLAITRFLQQQSHQIGQRSGLGSCLVHQGAEGVVGQADGQRVDEDGLLARSFH